MGKQIVHEVARPYLVIPKLIEQPTWGGEYIVTTKKWQHRPELAGYKIGQSYELFSGSNLSLCDSSDDSDFVGELTDRDAVQKPTSVANSVPLKRLIETSAEAVLGPDIVAVRGANIGVLAKFTQARGNSFQIHLKEGDTDSRWKPKLETWYYFEPGLLTLGIRQGADWQTYHDAVLAVDTALHAISQQVKAGQLTYEAAKPPIRAVVERHNPWQFVNLHEVGKDELVDLSRGGVHHSWEEDTDRLPLGNVLYEVQNDVMDDVSTLRSFDRGKMGPDGTLRNVHIEDYFRLIDRSPEANDPQSHRRQPTIIENDDTHNLAQLITTRYYGFDKLTLTRKGAEYRANITQFNHLFVKSGRVIVSTPVGQVMVGTGHACFVPAAAGSYRVCGESAEAVLLITK